MCVEWDIVLLFNTKEFVRKYAFFYTGILAVLLIAPLIIYMQLLLQIDEAKVKLSLHTQAEKIIASMQGYQNEDKIYHFPRYKEYKSALYTSQYKVVFSLLDFEPLSFTEGFHKEKDIYYYVYKLPDKYYFSANYLLVSTVHTANNIYLFALTIMIIIMIALFIFSFLLLRNFSRPFEQINLQLDNFIKDSMHEINTPLSIINLNTDLFASKYGDNKYLKRIKSASKTLATIYNDMDYLVKEGRVKYQKSLLDFSQFIQNRVDYFQEIAQLKQIELHTNICPHLEHMFSKTKLQRIVDNTISNAIKYSKDNSSIEIKLYKIEEHIVFEVQDYGVGIKDTDKIFSRYYREDEAKGGFGIGLNIVKKIIDEENIQLKISSIFAKGTNFCYTF